MQVELTEVDASADQRKIVLDRLPVTIGQSPEAGVRLDHHWVSRHHCELSATRDTLVVRDLGSMLGTFVNGLNVTTANVMPGDKLTVGGTSFVVAYERRNGKRRARVARREELPFPPAQKPSVPLPPAPTSAESEPPPGRLWMGRLPRFLWALLRLRRTRMRPKPR